MSREDVEEFLKSRETFTKEDFKFYMMKHGYKLNTVYKWIWILKNENIIKEIRRNKRNIVYKVVNRKTEVE